MTTIIPVAFSLNQVPEYQVTLDNQEYNLTLTWNLYAQRYYVNCQDLDNTLVFSLPLVGSPPGQVVQSLTWVSGEVSIVTDNPHGYRPGTTVRLTLSDAVPSGYSGEYDMLVTGASNLKFSLPVNPGTATGPGNLYTNLDLAWGYFETSVLVWRPSSNQLEVTP